MEELGQAATGIGLWVAWSLWLAISSACILGILISLPGGWTALGLAFLFDLFFGFDLIGWTPLLGFAALLVVAEIIEAVLGTVYVAKKGATRYGMAGGFFGGILGAIAGSGALPLLGTVIGGFAGAFAGAVAGEYVRDQRLEPSLRIGLHATIGKMLSVGVKFALAATGLSWVAASGAAGL